METITRLLGALALAMAVIGSVAAPVSAESRLPTYLQKLAPGALFAGADRFGPVEGDPPAAPVFNGKRLVGYAFLNADVANATGYSGKPINIVVALSPDGKIAGAKLVEHHEPIVLIGIPQAKVEGLINGFVGRDPQDPPPARQAGPSVDIVSGATVSSMVIADSITRSAIAVAKSRHLGRDGPGSPAGAPATAAPAPLAVDLTKNRAESWRTLLEDGSVRRLRLSIGDVDAAFERAGNKAAADHPESGDRNDPFIDLYVAPVSVPSIGRSLLGDADWAQLKQSLKPGQQAILIGANGAYSFKGSGYVRGGIFDRFAIIQGETSLRFRDGDQQRLGAVAAAGAPDLREIGLFTVPDGQTLDPAQPWRLQLLVQRAIGARDKAFLTFNADYALPDKYLNRPRAPGASTAPSASDAMWRRIWRAKMLQIGVLAVALAILAGVFFFQDWLTRRPVLYDRFRLGYLAFSLVFLGWYAKAQLSVVNVFTFAHALRADFRWEYFLMDPLIFILWSATAIAILFWNRGAFCGWLCPFGALQELLNRAARAVGLKQIRVPSGLHQRLAALKYVIFVVLFGVSLYEVGMAERMSEVEPFKTAIVLRFMRDWPFVAFALALLAVSLVIERFFCRYLCPLGAALAIPARLRVFDWLKRYRECGNPCQRCGNECPVQAIHPDGRINPNECIQCLHCQMLYQHDHKCPVLIQRRRKREARQAPAAGPGDPPTTAAPRHQLIPFARTQEDTPHA